MRLGDSLSGKRGIYLFAVCDNLAHVLFVEVSHSDIFRTRKVIIEDLQGR